MVPMPSGSKARTARRLPIASAKSRYHFLVRLSSATPPPSYLLLHSMPWWRMTTISGVAPGWKTWMQFR
jgi:hypothetical protein